VIGAWLVVVWPMDAGTRISISEINPASLTSTGFSTDDLKPFPLGPRVLVNSEWITVKGTSDNLQSEHDIWLVIQEIPFNNYYPAPARAAVIDGGWRAYVDLNKLQTDYLLLVIDADPEASSRMAASVESATKRMPELPKGAEIRASLTVRRE
jgi:hypothetical protein